MKNPKTALTPLSNKQKSVYLVGITKCLSIIGPDSVSGSQEFCLLLLDWARITQMFFHLMLPGDKWQFYCYNRYHLLLSLFFYLMHDLVRFSFSRFNIVFGRYQFISSCYSEHSALVGTVSRASPVFSCFVVCFFMKSCLSIIIVRLFLLDIPHVI